jgi:phosphoribosylamine--glycine ligase
LVPTHTHMPRKFLFVSLEGLIGDPAWAVAKEGHDVKYFIANKDERQIADGFVEKSADWRRDVDWADVIVFDDVLGQGTEAQRLRKDGKLVVVGTPYTDRLEDDRSFGQQELRAAGVGIIQQKDFTSFDEAIEFVRANPNRYAIKPSGEAQNMKGLLFVGEEEDGQDVLQVLEDYKKAWSDKIRHFQLQRRIQGVEVATGAFFNGREFVTPICVNFEHKKLFPGDIGPSTGEMGTAMFWSEPNRIFNATLLYPLEFTARFGFPTISIQHEGLLTPMSELLHGIASGELSKVRARGGFQVGVRIVVPPFPFTDPERFESSSKDAVILFKTPSREGIHIEDVKQVNGEWLVTGTSGVALIVCGVGPTMRQAQRQAYNRVRNVMIPNMYYREDIGDRWSEEDSDRLHAWRYLRES